MYPSFLPALKAIIAVVIIIIPIAKILATYFDLPRWHRVNLHKFSMVDIFLLSFLVYSSKISSVFDVEIQVGFYFLVISIAIGYLKALKGLASEKN